MTTQIGSAIKILFTSLALTLFARPLPFFYRLTYLAPFLDQRFFARTRTSIIGRNCTFYAVPSALSALFDP